MWVMLHGRTWVTISRSVGLCVCVRVCVAGGRWDHTDCCCCSCPDGMELCLTTTVHSRTLAPSNRAWKLGYSLGTSVHSAFETFATIALYKSTYTVPYHADQVSLRCWLSQRSGNHEVLLFLLWIVHKAQIQLKIQLAIWQKNWSHKPIEAHSEKKNETKANAGKA